LAFLRLPVEIRNQIYAYALRHTKIPKFSGPYEIDVIRCLPLPADLWLLAVSRQIHAETRLLPFKLNAFQMLPKDIGIFVNKLSNAQRDAITTFRVCRGSFEFTSGFIPVADMHIVQSSTSAALWVLETMIGLERVVIHGCVAWDKKNVWALHSEKEISAWIRRCAGNREIEVVFEYNDLALW